MLLSVLSLTERKLGHSFPEHVVCMEIYNVEARIHNVTKMQRGYSTAGVLGALANWLSASAAV